MGEIISLLMLTVLLYRLKSTSIAELKLMPLESPLILEAVMVSKISGLMYLILESVSER